MINFKTYLTEARMAPLYHSTSSWSAVKILKSNEILTGQSRPGYHGEQVSLTRDIVFAANWSSVIFELDQQKLAQNYRIVPFNFFGRDYNFARRRVTKGQSFEFINQSEEAIYKTIKPLDRYLRRIILNVYNLENIKADPKLDIILKQQNLYLYDSYTRKVTKYDQL